MTLCIAATCLNRNGKSRIVVSSDWRTELGTLAAAEVQNKLYWLFKGSWCVLIAGTVPSALSLISTIRSSVKPERLTRANIEDQLNRAVLKHRNKLVKRYVKTRLNVTFKHYLTHRSELDKATWTETQAAIEGIGLDCSLLVCTFIKREVFIFQVDEECAVTREENFAAIGSGKDVASAILCFRRQHEGLPLEETVYHLFEATRFARKANVPGVGKLHAFSILYPGRKQRRLRQRGLRQLSEYFDEYGPKKVKKVGLPKECWQNY